MTDNQSAATSALTTIIGALTPLSSEERQRIVNAAMTFLGEPIVAPKQKTAAAGHQPEADDPIDGDHPVHWAQWMKQYSISGDELDQIFHFNADGSFDVLDAPGNSKKEKTLNTYILTGLGKYLATKERDFDDATARRFCEKIRCYDQANHAAHMKSRGPEFTGDKTKGYVLTNSGIKRGAGLVKELTSEAG